MVGRRAQMGGDEVAGISAQLVLCQTDDKALQRAGRKHQQERAADELKEAVQPLEDDADLEGNVELGAFDRRLHGANLNRLWSSPRLCLAGTASSGSSAAAAWRRSISRTTNGTTGRWRSRSCGRKWPRRWAPNGSFAKSPSPLGSTIHTSSR